MWLCNEFDGSMKPQALVRRAATDPMNLKARGDGREDDDAVLWKDQS